MTHLYVCHFSNGHIKVGRSTVPMARIAQHEARVGCVGVELIEHHVVECAGHPAVAEAALIQRCVDAGGVRRSSEWFSGLDYLDVREWAGVEAGNASHVAGVSGCGLKAYLATIAQEDRGALAAAVGTTCGHLRNISYGQRQCSPELAAALERESKAAVMRWDMRPDDWHLIWPELVKRKGAPAKAEA